VTGIGYLADHVTPGSGWWSPTLHCSALAWQLPIIGHRTDVHGAFSKEQQYLPADKPHNDDE